MGSYYYLMSSLPLLRFEDPSPFDKASFLALCKSQLSQSEYRDLEAFLSSRKAGSHYARYQEFCSKLDQLINRARKLVNPRFGDPGREDVDVDKALAERARALVAKTYAVLSSADGDPLAAQIEILKLKWDYASQMDRLHCLDALSFTAYAIKLSLLWQREAFDPITGSMEFKRLFSDIQSEIKSV